ncbi:MAG: CHRD domain-containing protein [Actinomycetota bacterium]|nr:CHRD domain-containing protein [Actinomycetota bacterium]
MRAFRILALAGLAVLFGAPPAQAKMVSYTATLSPDEEVPTKGPSGASGTAKIDINTDTNQVCFDLAPTGLPETPTAGHIHSGAKGASGPVVIDFNLPASGLKNCVTSEAAKVAAVTGDPGNHYVNIHTASYQAGAMRGQLVEAAASTTTQPVPDPLSALPRTGTSLTVLLAGLGLALTGMGTAARAVARRAR